MSPITHFLLGWSVASTDAQITKRERAAVALAGVAPDIDGIGVVWDLLSQSNGFEFYQRYHHVFGHNLCFGILLAVLGLMLGVRKRAVAALVFLSFHLHLLGDIAGARGQRDDLWAVPYFWPFSAREYYWSGQWALNAWQNFLITGIALVLMFFLAWKRGYSPIEIVSARADRAFVRTLRDRFGHA